MEDNVLHLDIWPGDWGLPSVDPNCLASLAYCRFSGVPVKVNKPRNILASPNGTYPVMKLNTIKETKVANIFNFLRKKNWGSDFGLSNKESADVVAFTSLLDWRLLPAFLHIWWVDADTYDNVSRPWFTKATMFPMKFWLSHLLKSSASKRVYSPLSTENTTDSDIEVMIYNNAKECLTSLSQKLADKEYFFGATPSSLDALVFGYVGPLLKAPLSSNPLTNHLRSSCENLCLHCNRILKKYFPPTQEELEAREKEEAKKKVAAADHEEFPNKQRNMILAGVFALTSMVTYVFYSGIVSIQTVVEGEEEEEGDYY